MIGQTVAMLLVVCASLLPAQGQTLKRAQTVPLPGVSGRFDHFSVDVTGERLFVAALGNNTVEVIDLQKPGRIKSIPDLRKPQGVLYLAGTRKLHVANGGDGTLRVFDGNTLAPEASLRSLDDADNVRFDPATQRIYVGFGDGALGITDASETRLSGRIELKGHPESFQLEPNGPRIFVNVPDANMVAVVDREKRTVVAQWPMEKFRANFPMALDEPNHRLFVGCRRPARLVIFDTAAGRPVADLEISGDTDDLFFDAKRQRLYVSCGEGFIDVIQRRDGDRYARIERIPTRSGARTSYFSPERDRLYLAVPERSGQEAEVRVYQPN